MAAKAMNLKFCKVALLEQPNFQNGPFWKIRFYRTGRSGKSDFIERPVLEKNSPVRAAEFSELACLGKGDFPKWPVLENHFV